MEQEKLKDFLQKLISDANDEELCTVEEIIEAIVQEVEIVLAPSFT